MCNLVKRLKIYQLLEEPHECIEKNILDMWYNDSKYIQMVVDDNNNISFYSKKTYDIIMESHYMLQGILYCNKKFWINYVFYTNNQVSDRDVILYLMYEKFKINYHSIWYMV